MADPIQRMSTVPLPKFQTSEGGHDPLPLNAPKQLAKVAGAIQERSALAQSESFADYLNQTSITTVEKIQAKRHVDPASEIAAASAYGQPGRAAI